MEQIELDVNDAVLLLLFLVQEKDTIALKAIYPTTSGWLYGK